MREDRLRAEGAFSSEGDSESIVDELERGARPHAGDSDLTPSRARAKRCASWCGCSCNVRALHGPLWMTTTQLKHPHSAGVQAFDNYLRRWQLPSASPRRQVRLSNRDSLQKQNRIYCSLFGAFVMKWPALGSYGLLNEKYCRYLVTIESDACELVVNLSVPRTMRRMFVLPSEMRPPFLALSNKMTSVVVLCLRKCFCLD